MAGKKKNSGLSQVDSWTSNGYGLTVGKQTPEQKAAVRKVNAELAAAKKNKPKPKPKKK